MVKHGVEAEELQAYLDGELTLVRQADVETHLRECHECAALLEDLKRVSAKLKQWQVEPAPASLRPPAVETEKRRWAWLRMRPAMALAATAAVVLVVAVVSLPNLYRSKSIDLERSEPRQEDQLTYKRSSEPAPVPPAVPEVAEEKPAPSTKTGPFAARGVLQRVPPAAVGLEGAPAETETKAETYALEKFEAKDEAAGGVPSGVAGVVGGRLEAQKQAAPLRADEIASLDEERRAKSAAAGEPAFAANRQRAESAVARRLIAYHVYLTVEVKEFAASKQKVERLVEEAGGYVAQSSAAETPDQPQRADLVLRVPAEQLQAVLAALRGLGRVVNEQLSSQELTEQVVDLEARLRNARATEQRLIAVLNERTGKVRDILEVEREIARTRQEIERMEAQRQNLLHRVELATVAVTLLEEFQARLEPAPVGTGTRLRNAFVEGYERFAGMLLGFVFFFARYGLALIFWGGLLWLTGRLCKRTLVRRLRPAAS